MPGDSFNRLQAIAIDQHGYVTVRDANAVGVTRYALAQMVKRGSLEHVSRGVYRFSMMPVGRFDQYVEAALWPSGITGVLSYDTALSIYELSDVNPSKIHITVPKSYRVQREVPAIYIVHREDLAESEVTFFEGVPVVTADRAVRECSSAGLGVGVISQAIDDGERIGIFTRAQAAELRLVAGALQGVRDERT